MRNSYSAPYEKKPSLDLNYFEKGMIEFNDGVEKKLKYIDDGIQCDFSGNASLSDLFLHLFPNFSKYEFDYYLNIADGSSRRYNLARMLVLNDSGASKDLIFQAVENENKYVLIYTLIKIGFNEDEINELFFRHDSPHEIDIKKLQQDSGILLQEKKILQHLKKQDANNPFLTETSLYKSKRVVSAFNPQLLEKTGFSHINKDMSDSKKIEITNKIVTIDIAEKNRKIARAVDDYGVSKKLARFAYNNKIVFNKSIKILKELTVSGIEYEDLKKIVRGSFDLSMLPYSKSITNFYLAQYNYNVSLEGSKVSDILTGSLIIDFNYVLSGKPKVLRKEIIEVISLKKDEVAFSSVELITLINGGVSDELLYSVAKGEITASEAYLIHVFKVRKNEIKIICNKIRSKELSSEGIFSYAKGVRQDGNTQPDINNKLAPGIQGTLNGKTKNVPLPTELESKGIIEPVNNSESARLSYAESERGISKTNIDINISENRAALERQKSQIDEGISKSFILYLNLSKKTNDVIFDKVSRKRLFQTDRLKGHEKIISFLSPERNYGLIEISNLVILAENNASDDILKSVANGDVLFQQAYVEIQCGVIDKNIVEKSIKREDGGITVHIDGGTVMTSSKKGCQENQTVDECPAMYKKQVAKAADKVQAKRKLVANNINSKVMLSPKSDISSEGYLSPLTYLMSSILENSEMLCSYNSPTNSNALASFGDMLAVS
ncbi:hypothetical protein yaldo0001_25930 [Yersinia aldovae ATCC 35236]|uniref:Uncharacterized protein n=1 Tax=Yersinia aldovae TaxID=29483 RepID=A0A0T9TZC4_YERAL|nr:hypothetical protein [Yersinia aldovae]EEP96052.1 hypothetical protein yaldo0001_25930 [Yersinia aldovae ATCC 35236]CNL10180.1 Uncharacterised protein [Yersinia aldovae]